MNFFKSWFKHLKNFQCRFNFIFLECLNQDLKKYSKIEWGFKQNFFKPRFNFLNFFKPRFKYDIKSGLKHIKSSLKHKNGPKLFKPGFKKWNFFKSWFKAKKFDHFFVTPNIELQKFSRYLGLSSKCIFSILKILELLDAGKWEILACEILKTQTGKVLSFHFR